MFTRDQMSDLQVIIKETIVQLISDKDFLNTLVENIQEKLEIKKTQKKVHELTVEVLNLKEENRVLKDKMENLEQHKKRKSLRIHGVPESKDEKVAEKILEVVRDKMNLNIRNEDIETHFRTGKIMNGKRSILVSFARENIKKIVVQNRGRLKGTGISITEDVTPEKYALFLKAKQKLGKENVWIFGGEIRARLDQKKISIKSGEDLDQIQ